MVVTHVLVMKDTQEMESTVQVYLNWITANIILFSFPDINECDIGTHNCSVMANCTNVDGSFNCTCTKGYIGDGVTCEGILYAEVFCFCASMTISIF